MTRASVPTLLSLDRFSQIMGINPMHFSGANADPYFPLNNRCSDLWLQHSWQYADSVSREDLAYSIADAEESIANELGWWPAPVWISQEIQQYPQFYRRGGYDGRARRASVSTEFVKVISPGRRAVTIVSAAAAVAFTDADGDGFAETATITAMTTITDCNELFVYYIGEGGAREWEIRPARSKSISAGVVTFTFWSWQLIDPVEWEEFPNSTDEQLAIDLSGLTELPVVTDNLVTTVDVYRVYTDTSQVAAELVWEPSCDLTFSMLLGQNCGVTLTMMDGTFSIRDAERGLIVPISATYNVDTKLWGQTCYSFNTHPDFVKLWYYAGLYANRYMACGKDPLSDRWALAIAQLAVARLERPFCSCGNVLALAQKWQLDLAHQGETSWNVSPGNLDNPFGTRWGEIECWKKVKRERRKIRGGGAI